MTFKISTNNVPRLIAYGYELPESARSEFDYLDWASDESDNSATHNRFVSYLGEWIDLDSLLSTYPNENWGTGSETLVKLGWQGYSEGSYGNSAVTGVVVRFVENDDDRVIIGRYINY